MTVETGANLHVVFKGQTADIDFEMLGITPALADREILERLAQHFDRAVAEMEDYTVVREANGNITIRPSAVFGK